jgi:uncharacterized protein (DUF433 family)
MTSSVLAIGRGLYTVSEISKILRLPYYKVNRWLNKYWDGQLGKAFNTTYSNKIKSTKAVSFYTLIEFYVCYQLLNAQVPIKNIIKARLELTKKYGSNYPFAQKDILLNIKTDGSKVFIELGNNDILSLDGTQQLNITFIKQFYKNLDFDKELMATRYWPLGKAKSVIVDPKHQFGHPVVENTNIYPETLFGLYRGGESIEVIAKLYDLTENEVKDAIEYCYQAA